MYSNQKFTTISLVAMYPGTEDNLYTITDMVVLNCINDLKSFAGHKKKYTTEYLEGIEAIKALAKGIPNQIQRQAAQDALRVKTVKANEACCTDANSLQSYITIDGFKEEDIPAVLKLAGENYYANAARNNWQATGTMMELMTDCISTYPEELAAAGMPADFPAGAPLMQKPLLPLSKAIIVTNPEQSSKLLPGLQQTMPCTIKYSPSLKMANSSSAKMLSCANNIATRRCLIR